MRAACVEDYLYNLLDQEAWSLIRTAFQVCIVTAYKLMKAYFCSCNDTLDIPTGRRAWSWNSKQYLDRALIFGSFIHLWKRPH